MKNNLVIILGAGMATRLGYPKGLFIYQNKKLIEWHLEQIKALGFSVVLILNKINLSSYDDFVANNHYLINSQVEQGPIHSIHLGLQYGIENFETFFLLPIDTLPLQDETWKKLLESREDLVVPSYNKKAGHPPKLTRAMAQTFLNKYQNYSRMDHFFKQQNRFFCEVNDCNIISNINS